MHRIRDPSKRKEKNDSSCTAAISHVRVNVDVCQSEEEKGKKGERSDCGGGGGGSVEVRGGERSKVETNTTKSKEGQSNESARAGKSPLSGARQPSKMKNGLQSLQARLTEGKKESAKRTKGGQTRAALSGADLHPTPQIKLTAHSQGPYFTSPAAPFGSSNADAFLSGKRESSRDNGVVNKDEYVFPPIKRKKTPAHPPRQI